MSWLPLRTNVLETDNKNFLKTCHFSPENLYCPIFRLGTIVRWAGADFQDIALKVGGVCSGRPSWGHGLCSEKVRVGRPFRGRVILNCNLSSGALCFHN